LSEDQFRVPVPGWLRALESGTARRIMPGLFGAMLKPARIAQAHDEKGNRIGYAAVVTRVIGFMVPLVLVLATFLAIWWYVTIYSAPQSETETPAPMSQATSPASSPVPAGGLAEPPKDDDTPQALGNEEAVQPDQAPKDEPLQQLEGQKVAASDAGKIPEGFYTWFWLLLGLSVLATLIYYWRMDSEGLEILMMLEESIVALGVLTAIVLAVILLGITTATESAAVGALGAMYLAGMAKYMKRTLWASLVGGLVGLALGTIRNDP